MTKLRIALIGILVAAIGIISISSHATSQKSFTEGQTKDIQKIVYDYLIKNPNVLVEVSQALHQQEEQKAAKKANEAIAKNRFSLINPAVDPIIGNQNADVSVVEFMDYQCAHCKTMNDIIKTIVSTDPKVRFVIKKLPIFGKNSDYAARAAIASVKQGKDKFNAFHNELLGEKTVINDKNVMEIAKKVGLDINKLKVDMEDEKIKAAIRDNFRLAKEMGLLGTPAFIVINNNATKFHYIAGETDLKSLQSYIAKMRS